jgi:hypothetical protein
MVIAHIRNMKRLFYARIMHKRFIIKAGNGAQKPASACTDQLTTNGWHGIHLTPEIPVSSGWTYPITGKI